MTVCATAPSIGWILLIIAISGITNLLVSIWIFRGDVKLVKDYSRLDILDGVK